MAAVWSDFIRKHWRKREKICHFIYHYWQGIRVETWTAEIWNSEFFNSIGRDSVLIEGFLARYAFLSGFLTNRDRYILWINWHLVLIIGVASVYVTTNITKLEEVPQKADFRVGAWGTVLSLPHRGGQRHEAEWNTCHKWRMPQMEDATFFKGFWILFKKVWI